MSDTKMYFETMQDKATQMGFMTTPKTLTEARKEIKKRISHYKKKKITAEDFAIEINGEFAGYVGIHSLDENPLTQKGSTGVIGYCLHPKFRGKGIMTKAVKLITDYSFKKYKIKRISGRCRSFNKVSAKILEKAGYSFEGKHRKEIYKNKKYYDNLYYAKIK